MKLADKGRYVTGLFRKHGFLGLVRKAVEKKMDSFEKEYRKNYREWMPDEETLLAQRAFVWEDPPFLSVVVPAYETPEIFMRQLIESVVAQTYDRWELVIADASSSDRVERIVRGYQKSDSRIRYRRLRGNGGISVNTNKGLAMAKGSYIGLLDHDDILSAQALFCVARAIKENPSAQVFYSDEDKVSADLGRHMQAHLKPDFDRELLYSYNYICHFLVFSKEILRAAGGLNPEYDGSQDYDFVLRLSEREKTFVHIPKILYHWRVHSRSTAASSMTKDYAYEAGQRALEAHFKRIGRIAEVEPVKGGGYYRVYNLEGVLPCDRHYTSLVNLQAEFEKDKHAKWFVVWDARSVRGVGIDCARRMLAYGKTANAGIVGIRFRDYKYRLLDAGLERAKDGSVRCLFQGLLTVFHGYFDRAVLPRNVEGVRLAFCVVRREALEAVCDMLRTEPELLETLEGNLLLCEEVRRQGYSVLVDSHITALYY